MQLITRFSCLAVLLAALPAVAEAQTVVGIVGDGPMPDGRRQLSIEAIDNELRQLVGNGATISFPVDKRIDGGWTRPGIVAAMEQLLADPDVDIVLTTGLVAGSVASQLPALSKPVMAVVVADHELQAMPTQPGSDPLVSGKDNFVYLSDFGTIDDEIRTFQDAFRFTHLAVLIDELTYQSIPDLAEQKAAQLEAELGITIDIYPETDSAASALADLAAYDGNTGAAVYVTPLLRFDDEEMQILSQGLIDRRLPSFSLIGRNELERYGLLMATSGRAEDQLRLTRRVAINLQRIIAGENPREIGVIFRESTRRIVNMTTAVAIDRVPRFSVLTDAEQIPPFEIESGETMSLAEAMLRALDANLDLGVAAFDMALSAEDVRAARAALKPRLGLGVDYVVIDEDRANPLLQSERSTAADLSATQLIYSDDVRARLRLTEFIEAAVGFEYEAAVLDTLQETARAYLTVLRARDREGTQRSNLEITRNNLELARIREAIGFSDRSDRLRWESQYATDLQNVMAAEAERRVALTALNRLLNLPQDREFVAPEDLITETLGIFLYSPRFQQFIDDDRRWQVFQQFTIGNAIATAPEIHRIDALIAGQERQLLASERKGWLPELAVGASAGSVLSRSGAGSDLTGTGLDDETWNVALNASLPIFNGGAVRARTNSDELKLQQLRQARLSLVESIEARTRLALFRASGTYPAIEPAEDARVAAFANLALVNDSYSIGLASVTEVIDAQTAANLADLRATDTLFAALVDVIDVFRSSGDLSIFFDTGRIESWYDEALAYFRERGIEVF